MAASPFGQAASPLFDWRGELDQDDARRVYEDSVEEATLHQAVLLDLGAPLPGLPIYELMEMVGRGRETIS